MTASQEMNYRNFFHADMVQKFGLIKGCYTLHKHRKMKQTGPRELIS